MPPVSPIKVVQFVPNLNSGGVERGTLEIAQALVNAGHESHVASNGGRMVDELTRQGSIHHQWALHRKSPTTLLKTATLRRWLEDLEPDIIHVRSRMPAWVVWLAWRKMNPATRPRLVTTLHGLHSISWYSKIMGRGERVIAVSKAAERYLCDHCGVLPNNIRLIHRGTDPSEFPRNYQPSEQWLKAWAAQFPQLQGKRLICLPGRISRLKAHHHLITSLQRLKAEGTTNVAGLIVGGKDATHEAYFRELQAQVIKAGVAEDIVFAGHRSDMREIYAISSVVLAVSNKAESFGRTALEPLCIGTPVVGFDIGGVGEILAAMFPAGRVPNQDSEALCSTIAAVLADASVTVAENTEFLLSNMCTQTLQTYEELMLERSSLSEADNTRAKLPA